MGRIFVRLIIITLPLAACSDAELLSVAATVGANNAVGETSEVYTRLARQAQSCWFKPGGLIKKSHMFYAEAAPNASGGKAEISIRRRRKNGEPGEKAFIINLIPSGDNTLYSMRNITLDKNISARMIRDIKRWVNLELGCVPSTHKKWKPKLPSGSTRKSG